MSSHVARSFAFVFLLHGAAGAKGAGKGGGAPKVKPTPQPTPVPTPEPPPPPLVHKCANLAGVELHTGHKFGDDLKCGFDELQPLTGHPDWAPGYMCSFKFNNLKVGGSNNVWAIQCGGESSENAFEVAWKCDDHPTMSHKFSLNARQPVTHPPEAHPDQCSKSFQVSLINKNSGCKEVLKAGDIEVTCQVESAQKNKHASSAAAVRAQDVSTTTTPPLVPVAAVLVIAAVFFVLMRSGKAPVSDKKTPTMYNSI